jgi:hypothetical protein
MKSQALSRRRSGKYSLICKLCLSICNNIYGKYVTLRILIINLQGSNMPIRFRNHIMGRRLGCENNSHIPLAAS